MWNLILKYHALLYFLNLPYPHWVLLIPTKRFFVTDPCWYRCWYMLFCALRSRQPGPALQLSCQPSAELACKWPLCACRQTPKNETICEKQLLVLRMTSSTDAPGGGCSGGERKGGKQCRCRKRFDLQAAGVSALEAHAVSCLLSRLAR